MQFTVGLTDIPFSLQHTLESGEVFRWENSGEWWYGVVSGGVLKVKQEGETLRVMTSSDLLNASFIRDYFRLDEPLSRVYASIAKDETMSRSVQSFYGMRLIRQERWECLASFVLATNSNIPRIKQMVASVATRFGDPIDFDGTTYHSFPKPEKIAGATVAELEDCGTGYRAPFLKKVAKEVDEGRIDFSELAIRSYAEARDILLKELFGEKQLLGVGPKVADCVLLFSCGKDEAFPIDVWIARALNRYYPGLLETKLREKLSAEEKASLSKAEYDRTSESVRKYFGEYAGYAQQYLFKLARAEEPT